MNVFGEVRIHVDVVNGSFEIRYILPHTYQLKEGGYRSQMVGWDPGPAVEPALSCFLCRKAQGSTSFIKGCCHFSSKLGLSQPNKP